MKGLFFLSALSAASIAFAQSKQDTVREIDEVRVIKRLPITKDIVNVEKDLGRKNLGQDLPYLLKNQTSVETTTDAGNGVGYTGLRIRGVDGTRINVMLNGVPYNDSESQGTFFVNIPDVTSSASNVIIQRGVGTSTNGVAAFGASVNIIGRDPEEQPYFSTQNSVGSFNTHKHSFEAGTGSLLNGKLSFMGRYSIIKSDGYIDRAFSDLNSYNFVGVYKDGNTKIRFQTFGGDQQTYQAWNGISKVQYEINPRYNPSGEIYDKDGKVIGFYKNETDNYKQQHYHLLWEQRFNDNWKLNTTLHYTRGLGYYENYKSNQKFSKYGIPPYVIGAETITSGDMIRRKWLDNDFYGIVSELNGKVNKWDLNFGIVANQYYGRHYGQIISGSNLQQIDLPIEYYRNNATKNEISGYAKALYKFGDLEMFGDLQLRNITYHSNVIKASAEEAPTFDKKFTFFNPKVGFNYHLDGGTLYLSYANAHREPVRDDIVNAPDVKPETLHDFELGYNKIFNGLSITANAYYMLYKDQLVLIGAINGVGASLRKNVGRSYRAGIELGAGYQFSEKFNALLNATFSQNKNKNYIVQLSETETENLGTTNTSFSPNFIGNLTLNYLPVKDLQFSLVNKLVGSQYLDNTNAPESKIKSYYLSDFIASYQVAWGRTDIGFSLLVNNIFNQKYINNGYSGPFYYAQAGANFLAGISLKFH
ncbi:TonB-dependent receptor [Elizabethkingia anophelis]|uniref:TonB-dependent receptor n=1 Tax=Elizabethkingia anophelis TaxID=1117645 RepID=UPI0020133A32|nr:TonB-dependent receptor [Elizabethkingia anophelis]EJC8059405.1 TonB-dependent receptor [Elizabethkingia anophelis]MCL1641862.1 TonB-dependent receptor [Elizabethkingia anophelis]MCL1644407.1 TonB-dependent receptor [Elizabethkingia anophelis]MCT3926134.1 TonB-dependent receptor [Elizabethkingia anophelis]MCT4032197.1 TonB-dependent receptor [Elizabethkingia anophelis]